MARKKWEGATHGRRHLKDILTLVMVETVVIVRRKVRPEPLTMAFSLKNPPTVLTSTLFYPGLSQFWNFVVFIVPVCIVRNNNICCHVYPRPWPLLTIPLLVERIGVEIIEHSGNWLARPSNGASQAVA